MVNLPIVDDLPITAKGFPIVAKGLQSLHCSVVIVGRPAGEMRLPRMAVDSRMWDAGNPPWKVSNKVLVGGLLAA